MVIDVRVKLESGETIAHRDIECVVHVFGIGVVLHS